MFGLKVFTCFVSYVKTHGLVIGILLLPSGAAVQIFEDVLGTVLGHYGNSPAFNRLWHGKNHGLIEDACDICGSAPPGVTWYVHANSTYINIVKPYTERIKTR